MGLGLLLCGYLFCLNIFNAYTLLPAAVLMFLGLRKLARLNTPFRYALYLTFPLGAVGVAGIVLLCLHLFAPEMPNLDGISSAVALLSDLCMWAELTVLLSGIGELCAEVGLQKQRAAALRNRIYVGIYYLPAAVLECIDLPGNAFLPAMAVVWVLLGMAVFVLNAKLLLDCYRFICMPGNECPDDDPYTHKNEKK